MSVSTLKPKLPTNSYELQNQFLTREWYIEFVNLENDVICYYLFTGSSQYYAANFIKQRKIRSRS